MEIREFVKDIRNISFLILILILMLGFIYNSFFVVNKGFRLIRKGKYKFAMEEFFKELKSKPNNWRLLYGIAYCYFMLGYSRNALEFYKKTLALQPNRRFLYTEMAILYIELEKDLQNAKLYLDRAISINKQKNFLCRSSRHVFDEIYGRIYLLQNDWDKAQKCLEKSIPKYERMLKKYGVSRMEKMSPLFYRLGLYYLQINESKKAIKLFKQIINNSSESFFAEKSFAEIKRIEQTINDI